jgi:cytochrome b6-f complex iron-sulfur subunit
MERISRRTFIKFAAAVAGVITFAPIRSLFAENNLKWKSVGKMDDFTVGEPVLVNQDVQNPIIIYRQKNSISALSAKCAHKGCTVSIKKQNTYACPCHGAMYEYDGTVKKGPAKKDLESLPVKVSDTGEVLVGF